MVAGAADTPVTPIVVACFDAIKATGAAGRGRPRQCPWLQHQAEGRQARLDTVLTADSGFGGFRSAMVLRAAA